MSTLQKPLRWMRKQTWRRRDSAWESDEQTVSYEQMMSLDLAIPFDRFWMVKWPFRRVSDLQLGDKKVTLNHLGKCFFGVCDVICTLFFVDREYETTIFWGDSGCKSPNAGVFDKELCRMCVFFFWSSDRDAELSGAIVLSMKFCEKKNGFRI